MEGSNENKNSGNSDSNQGTVSIVVSGTLESNPVGTHLVDEVSVQTKHIKDTPSSKPQEKEYVADGVKCSICGVTSCPMWTRLSNQGNLCCNACHLKKVRAVLVSQQKGKERARETTTVTKHPRRGRLPKSKNGTVKNNEKVLKVQAARSRRSKLKRKPSRGADGIATICTSNKICHKDIIYHAGDIVAVTDFDGRVYFAQLNGFLQNDYGEKFGVITWLIPLVPCPNRFDPSLFVPGPTEDKPRPMECFDFVSRAPNDFFKWRATNITSTKSTADLRSLFVAANTILGTEV